VTTANTTDLLQIPEVRSFLPVGALSVCVHIENTSETADQQHVVPRAIVDMVVCIIIIIIS
jgi:hypothetical protein